MKCPNLTCKKEILCYAEDIKDEKGNELVDIICPFCSVHKDGYWLLILGEIEFNDRSELDGIKVRSIVEKLEEVLHETENLSYGEKEDDE